MTEEGPVRDLQGKTLLDSWMKQSNDYNALTDASFFRLLKDKSTFLSEPIIPGKNRQYEDIV